MDFQLFNIGPLELLFIILIMLVVLGPQDMEKMARKAGVWLYKAARSPAWINFMSYFQEVRNLPTKLAREAGLEESLADLRKRTIIPLEQQDKTEKSDQTGNIQESQKENSSPGESNSV